MPYLSRVALACVVLLSPVVVSAQAVSPLPEWYAAKPYPALKAAPALVEGDETCTPQVTHFVKVAFIWDPAPATSGSSTLVGYRVQRRQNDQRAWHPLVDLPKDTLVYTDGTETPLKPGNTYYYQVLALWQRVTGEVTPSEPGAYGQAKEDQPCLQILSLPPPGLLRATPKL